ncbi:MAG: phospholipase D-like domain-containing protein [Nitrososphaerota archaeon]
MIYASTCDDLYKLTIDFLSRARREVLICSYLLTMPAILAELVRAKQRGCEVKVLLSGDDRNKPVKQFLRSNGIDARLWISPKGILHAKYIIIDCKRALIASTNFTHDAMNNNYEIAYIVTNKKHVQKLRDSFLQEFKFSD